MFSFFKKQTGHSSVEPSANLLTSVTSEMYSMDFVGAEKIIVLETDCTKRGKPQQQKVISDIDTIKNIINLLKTLPNDGLTMIKIGPCIRTSVYAVKRDFVFAYVDFFGGSLKLENTAFGVGGGEMEDRQKELYQLLKFD